MTKSAGNYGFGHIFWGNPYETLVILCCGMHVVQESFNGTKVVNLYEWKFYNQTVLHVHKDFFNKIQNKEFAIITQ